MEGREYDENVNVGGDRDGGDRKCIESEGGGEGGREVAWRETCGRRRGHKERERGREGG